MNLAELEAREETREIFASMRKIREERRQAAHHAERVLPVLVRTMANKTGQSYKLRALLWSLYNGKPVSLIEILCLDWNLRQDLAAVILGFGYEESGGCFFFYDAIKTAMQTAGIWEWFRQEGDE